MNTEAPGTLKPHEVAAINHRMGIYFSDLKKELRDVTELLNRHEGHLTQLEGRAALFQAKIRTHEVQLNQLQEDSNSTAKVLERTVDKLEDRPGPGGLKSELLSATVSEGVKWGFPLLIGGIVTLISIGVGIMQIALPSTSVDFHPGTSPPGASTTQ